MIDELAAAALAVTGAIQAASCRRAKGTKGRVRRFYARWNEAAFAKRRRQVARLASIGAGRATADAVSTETALAIAIASAGLGLAFAVISRIGQARRTRFAIAPDGVSGCAITARTPIHRRRKNLALATPRSSQRCGHPCQRQCQPAPLNAT